jgi:large subunit ribosomal protein L25
MSDTIEASPRDQKGKGAAHKLRKAGKIPAVAYGPGVGHVFLSVDPRIFQMQRAQFGSTHIYEVKVEGGKTFKALVREAQVDPLSQGVVHLDLYALDMNKPIRIEVLIELTGKPAGAIDGGILQQTLRKALVECLPAKIPQKLTADASPLKIGDSLHLSDVTLPPDIKLITSADEAIATVILPAEEEVAAPVAAEGAAAEGAAAAPGAEGAAAAAPGKEGEKAPAGKEGAAPAKGGKEGDKAEKKK